nr:immunoglobulin heavy chain junction region [Mus musculus]MBK4196086.1 immunoglobulin heavy chain junction region [Mus musculus]MBK4196087.1 immunoglobulin heavy chain junction region [Mus musculus]
CARRLATVVATADYW